MAGSTPNGPGGPYAGQGPRGTYARAAGSGPYPSSPAAPAAPAAQTAQAAPRSGRILATAGVAGPPAPRNLAPRPRRLAAYLIDLAILVVALSPLLVPASVVQFHHAQDLAAALNDPREQDVTAVPFWARQWFLGVVLAVGFAVYCIPQVGLLGRTVGQRLLGLRVSRHDGRDPVGLPAAAIRAGSAVGR